MDEGKLVPQNLAEVFDLITFEDFKSLRPVEQDMLDALTGKKLCLQLAQHKLQSSLCFTFILEFLESRIILPF